LHTQDPGAKFSKQVLGEEISKKMHGAAFEQFSGELDSTKKLDACFTRKGRSGVVPIERIVISDSEMAQANARRLFDQLRR
jgi:hypothetical protein